MRKLMTYSVTLGCLALFLTLAANAQTPDSLTVNAFVDNQVCLSKDFVQVTLSATADSSSQPVGFRWDFNMDGKADTPRSTDPTVVHIYPDESLATSKVVAVNKEGNRAQDSITFTTLKCR